MPPNKDTVDDVSGVVILPQADVECFGDERNGATITMPVFERQDAHCAINI